MGPALRRFFSSTTKEEAEASPMSLDFMLYILFTANLAGILSARSLHYQFYSWCDYEAVWGSHLPSSCRGWEWGVAHQAACRAVYYACLRSASTSKRCPQCPLRPFLLML